MVEKITKIKNKRCAHCSSGQNRDTGWDLYKSGTHYSQIRCACGLMSKLFSTAKDAMTWWNTRGGKLDDKYSYDVTVTHNKNLDIPSTPDAIDTSVLE